MRRRRLQGLAPAAVASGASSRPKIAGPCGKPCTGEFAGSPAPNSLPHACAHVPILRAYCPLWISCAVCGPARRSNRLLRATPYKHPSQRHGLKLQQGLFLSVIYTLNSGGLTDLDPARGPETYTGALELPARCAVKPCPSLQLEREGVRIYVTATYPAGCCSADVAVTADSAIPGMTLASSSSRTAGRTGSRRDESQNPESSSVTYAPCNTAGVIIMVSSMSR